MKLSFPSFVAAFLVSQGHAARPAPPFHLGDAIKSDDKPELSVQKGSEVDQLRAAAAAAVTKGGKKNKANKRAKKRNSDNSETPAEVEGTSAVYVMSNQPDGNSILVYPRDPDAGTLQFGGSFPTGGNGAGQAGTAPGDPLASQDPIKVVGDCLLAVNAGSGTVSSFTIDGADQLSLVTQASTDGELPVSITEMDGMVYVLNSGGSGSFKGFRLRNNCGLSNLAAVIELEQEYDVSPAAPPAGIATPAEINFTPEGNLLVLIKVEGGGDMFAPAQSGISSLSHYTIRDNGRPNARSLVKTIIEDRPGSVPFAFDFDSQGRLLLVEAVTNTVSEWEINDDFTYTQVNSVSTEQAASCWIRFNPGNECFYTSNSGGNSISSLGAAPGHDHRLVESVAAGGIPGPIDLIASADGQNLYVLSPDFMGEDGPGIYAYSAASDCGLTQLPTVREGLDPSFLDETGVAGIAVYPGV